MGYIETSHNNCNAGISEYVKMSIVDYNEALKFLDNARWVLSNDDRYSLVAELIARAINILRPDDEELTPMDALVQFGMQANSFHRARDGFKKGGMAFIKIDHKRNGKIYHSYKMDKENSNIGGV